MVNGEWVKGMDSALSTARAVRLRLRRNRTVCVRGRYGTRATSWKFPFVPYSCILDRFWSPYGAFLKELTNLRLDCLFCMFLAELLEPPRSAVRAVRQRT